MLKLLNVWMFFVKVMGKLGLVRVRWGGTLPPRQTHVVKPGIVPITKVKKGEAIFKGVTKIKCVAPDDSSVFDTHGRFKGTQVRREGIETGQQTAEQLRRAIPRDQEDIYYLFCENGRDVRKTATILGIEPATVRSQVNRVEAILGGKIDLTGSLPV